MTTDLAAGQRLPGTLELAERDREAAEAVASGLKDAKAENTLRAYGSAWQQFQAWAEAGGHAVLPATPQIAESPPGVARTLTGGPPEPVPVGVNLRC